MISVINACRYYNVPHPPLCNLIDRGLGKNGPVTDKGAVLDSVDLTFIPIDSKNADQYDVSMITIIHEEQSLHSALRIQEENESYIVNGKLADSLVEKRPLRDVPMPTREYWRKGMAVFKQ